MSDEKYSIDDILAEIDRKRGGETHAHYEGSVTEIIGGSEIDEAIRSTAKHAEESVPEAQAAPEAQATPEKRAAVEAIAPHKPAEQQSGLAAKQRTESEENERRAAEIAAAAERTKQRKAEKAQKAAREREARERLAKERRESSLAAKQRTDEEVNERIAADISDAADKIKAHKVTEHTGLTEELASAAEASLLLFPDEPEKEAEEKTAPADDDIVFHSESELVTTETMELRKQQRIEEINRALLSADSAAESPDELLDSINPMDSRAKAAEQLKASTDEELEDTRAVSGNDLKNLANAANSEETVKEYSPAISRKKTDAEKRADDILFTPRTGKQRPLAPQKAQGGSDALVNSLNKQLAAQQALHSDKTVVVDDIGGVRAAPAEPLNIDSKKMIDTSIISGSDPVDEVRRADELAQKKKSKLASFMLEDIEEGVDAAAEDGEDDYDEEDEEIDLDDENVIAERLRHEAKGLTGRLVILGIMLAAALFIALTNHFGADWGFITEYVSKISHPDYYLYAYLIIGILSFSACSGVVTHGLSRLVRLHPDGDTLCAFAHIAAIGSLIPYLSNEEFIQRGRSHVYLAVSLAALCFNTVSKLCLVKAAQRNFRFTAGDGAKFFVQTSADEGAEQLAKGAVTGEMPCVASMRKTEMLCDFIISTYCEDASDRTARIIAPATLISAIVCGVIAYLTCESEIATNCLSWAFTAASAVFAVGAAFTGSFIVTLPMLRAAKVMPGRNAAILGCSAVEEFSETNAVLIEAKSLFPVNSVKINNIWDYNKHRSSNSPKVPIDEAIIYAASLSMNADSVLADAFFNMLNYKQQLLKPVSGCVYESGLGILGWIDHRRVLLGNREHMKSHEIVVPDMKKESAANKNGDEVIYLAVGGEICMLFFVELSANQQVKESVRRLSANGVSLVIKAVDGMITSAVIAELFDIEAARVRVLPFEAHAAFSEKTRYSPKGSAAVSCDGTFSAFAAAINGAKALRSKITTGCILEAAGTALGIVLVVLFMLFRNYDMLNCLYLIGFNAAWLLITAGAQAIKRL